MKAYLSIPITGYEQGNEPRARELAAKLTAVGYTVVVPHDVVTPDHPGPCPGAEEYPGGTNGATHGGYCYLKQDLIEMLSCDVVVVAEGWTESNGCKVEVSTADAVRIPVWKIETALQIGASGMLEALRPS